MSNMGVKIEYVVVRASCLRPMWSAAHVATRTSFHPSERERRLVEAHGRELGELRDRAEELQEARDKQVLKGEERAHHPREDIYNDSYNRHHYIARRSMRRK